MIYPKWFPRPKSWLRAIALLFYNMPSWILAFIVYRICLFFSLSITIINPNFLLFAGIILIFSTLTTYWLTFAYTYHFFWGQPDPNPKHLKWLPSNQSLKQGLKMMSASIIAYVLTVLLILPFADFYLNYEEKFRPFVLIIWLTVAAYCFHVKNSFNQRFKKPTVQSDSSPAK